MSFELPRILPPAGILFWRRGPALADPKERRGCPMRLVFRASWYALALNLSLAGCAFAQVQVSPSGLNSSQSPDESAVRAVVEKYFTLFGNKDLYGLLGLWSEKSPDYASLKQNLQRQFTTGDHRLSLPTMSRVKLAGEQASLRATVNLTATSLQSKETREQQLVRNFALVREDGKWKVWRSALAEDDLAEALVKAKTEVERAGLLAEEKELVTVELVRALSSQGDSSYNQGGYQQALSIYRLERSLAEKIGDRPGMARALNNIGKVHNRQENYAQALKSYQQSLALCEALRDNAGIARALSNIGLVHESQGNYTQALESLQQSLALRETLGDKSAIAGTLGNIAGIHLYQGNYAQALESLQKILGMFEALGDKARIASTLGNIGLVYSQQGNYAQALEHFQKSVALCEAVGDKLGVTNALNNIGLVHHQQGNYAQAMEYFQKSLALDEALGDKRGIALRLGSIGSIHRIQGNYARALESYQKSLAMSEALGDKRGIATKLNNIGNVHNLQGNYAQALESLQKSLALREGAGDKAGIASTLTNLGLVHHQQGNYAQALEHFQKSLAMSEAIGNKDAIANALYSIGRVHHSQGNLEQAMEYYQRSLAIREALGNKGGIAQTLKNIADVYVTQGQYSQALDTASRAAALASEIGDIEALSNARLAAGTAYRALKQPAQARTAFEEAITIIETLRANVAGGGEERQRFFESKVSAYHAMVDLLAGEGRPAEALTFAERAKARVLVDVLQTGRVNVTKAMTSQEQEQERTLNSRLVSLNTQISRETTRPQPDQARLTGLKAQLQKARLDSEGFQANLYIAHPELRAQRGETHPLKLEEITALLPDAKGALLEYVVTDDQTYLFAIARPAGNGEAEIQVYTLPIKRAELSRQTESFRQQLAGRDLGFRASAVKLYALLLKPAQAQLKGKSNLIIVPDDKLWELPFQALLTNAHRFLIEDTAVSYAPSLTVLREMTKRRQKRKADVGSATLLALGNPLLGKETIERATLALRDESLAPLPEAEQEVKALGQLYSAAHSAVYIGAEAREDRAKTEAGRATILHFATHGTLNNASPMYSHLVLAPGDKNEDGLLEAWELMQLDLKADLAVLSACETARGRYGAGEGMIGLTWAMFVAGVPSTVVSQWKVESAGTRDLMVNFHRALISQPVAGKAKPTKTEALRQAALRLMKHPETSHPFYWAGFVLVGDGR
jgi:CHAT domain-containing protein/tetratricopeptide (TPR) repeat protein